MPPPPAAEAVGVTDTIGLTLPDPLTINNVEALRTKQGRLVAGVAAKADIELFKGIGRHTHKPKAKNWDHRLTQESSSRMPSSLKSAAKYLSKPGMISLGGGLPSPEYFPFEELSLKLPINDHYSPADVSATGQTVTAGRHDLAEGKSIFDIATAFNYGLGSGSAQLLRFLMEHTEMIHNPCYQDWECSMTIGSTSALDMCLRMLANRGTYMLSEEYTFASAVETAAPLGVKTEGVPMDGEGLLATALDSILTNWDPSTHEGAPKPFILYTVPTGQNPTGATQSLQRRKDIYAVAQKHDLIILEDEPYYFLQMQPYTGQNAPDVPAPRTHEEFLASLVPSLLSLDTDGRVIRFDSFSKVIAPGARVGWITGAHQLVERYQRHADVSTQSPSGISQLALFKLLDEHWGHAGYLDWLRHIRLEYTRRRDGLLGACEDYLPRQVASWLPPMAGMFQWLRIDWRKHPLAGTLSVAELEERIWLRAIANNSLLTRGSWFRADQGRNALGDDEQMFFRATFCAASEDKIRIAIERFATTLREEFELSPAAASENGASNGNANGTNGHS